jgi:phenylacetate-coenzyme A ligase PaaK-like adenylate-forming protein
MDLHLSESGFRTAKDGKWQDRPVPVADAGMSLLGEIEHGIEELFTYAPYGLKPEEHEHILLTLLKKELDYAVDRSSAFRNYVEHWPIDFHFAEEIADLPYLPVRVFKANPPLALVAGDDVKRTLKSSATTGQVPSRVVLDTQTGRRMTKAVVSILRDFIGPSRRPYLVIDTPQNVTGEVELGARSAAIQALRSFATQIECCLIARENGHTSLDLEKLLAFAARWKNGNVLVYGFTYVIWTELVEPLQRRGITLEMPNVRVLHSGGWKRLQQQAITRDTYVQDVASVFGCSPDRVIDYYGMVENVGIIYPDCEYGNKHAPCFAEVIVRDPLTLAPAAAGQRGLIQVCSVLPTSFPGFLLLTEDMAEVMSYDRCPCGRRGISFRFAGRAPEAETRGCGNVGGSRYQQLESIGV